MVPQHSICAVTKATWWRQRWLKWGFQHGLLHLLGIERSIPDSQLCSWQHILGNNSGRYARGSTNQSAYRGEGAAQVSGGGRYLGGVEVHFVILLVSRQILVLVVAGRSHQHHPVAVLLTAGVKTHHYTVLLEDLPNSRERIKKEVKVKNHMHTYSLKQRV